jgi:hypothetical protein
MLAKTDYAYYTIGMSVMLMMAQLGDVGITTSIIALGGQAKSSRAALAAICEQGLTFRRQLAIYVVPIGITAAVWLLYRINCPPLILLGTAFVLGAGYWMLLGASIYGALAKVQGLILRVQDVELRASLLRIVIIFAAASLHALSALLALTVNAVAAGWSYLTLVRATGIRTACPSGNSSQYKDAFKAIMARQGPNTLYAVIEPQLFVILAAAFGGTTVVAELGALGRLAAALAVVGGVISAVAVPHVARETVRGARRIFCIVALVMVCLASAAVLVSYIFPRAVLWILGAQYYNLERDLILFLLGAFTRQAAGAAYSMTAARGIVPHPGVMIPAGIVTQIACIYLLGVETLRSLLTMNAVVGLVGLGTIAVYAYRAFAEKAR